MRQKQANCKKCGPVLAKTGDPPSFNENAGLGCLVFATLGLALPFVLVAMARRSAQARRFHCQQCGQRI